MIFPRIPSLVSIVIRTDNNAKHILQCLESLQQQTYPNVELMIVDDASTDDTQPKIEAWIQTALPKTPSLAVTFFKLPRHIGYGGSLTAGFFLCHGEYIALQHANDLSASSRIEQQVQYLIENSDIDLVGTNVELFDVGNFAKRRPSDWIEYGEDIKNSHVLGRPAIHLASVMFRGNLFDCLGGLQRDPIGMEDTKFISKCLDYDIGVDNMRETLYFVRVTKNHFVDFPR